ncbi:MAG: non-canonical purine NTP pyrophosphatase, RdgB/HAM1 family [Chloroflexi bacterium RBG_13_52_14]|nr:MAG: non-canonical purine NTP pyrophosphatase, RdgB/HAM1 family [Chloroflexi bacterium RBG_13_52_14]
MSKPAKLLVATNNKGKLREYADLLKGLHFELTTLSEQGITEDVEESGSSLEQNAVHKATAYVNLSGLITLADDSGLEVDALGGEPGPLSRRYAGENASDKERNDFLLVKLRDVPWEQRKARFRCIIAIAKPGGGIAISEGICEGIIALEGKGEGGFGYDPLFYLPELDKHMAELSLEEKNRISHRAKAAEQAEHILERLSRVQ